nr:unnamed protein product [Digitaria exilis]
MDGVQATQKSPSSSTAAYPPWVMFEPDVDLDTTGSYSTADPKTLVLARTSSNHPIGVSLRIASPPAESRVCVHFPQGSQPSRLDNQVIAAHGDSVLIKVSREGGSDKTKDYFVYNAGTAATGSPRPPSLSLLPPYSGYLRNDWTGILRRGEDDLVVACLKIETRKNDDNTPKEHVPEMLMFRSGKWWKIRWARIIGIENDELVYFWSSRVIPVGDNMLCWFCLHRGLIFYIVDDKRLVYKPLPDDPSSAHSGRNVCVTSAGNVVKFVNMFARCCCGGGGASECKHSKNCYAIKTWTLRMDSMTWVLDGMMDCTELWVLDAYKSLPRVRPEFPVVSMDEPHVIIFMVHEKEWWT